VWSECIKRFLSAIFKLTTKIIFNHTVRRITLFVFSCVSLKDAVADAVCPLKQVVAAASSAEEQFKDVLKSKSDVAAASKVGELIVPPLSEAIVP
jgi:ribosomal protein L18